jgi:hypothetical protein
VDDNIVEQQVSPEVNVRSTSSPVQITKKSSRESIVAKSPNNNSTHRVDIPNSSAYYMEVSQSPTSKAGPLVLESGGYKEEHVPSAQTLFRKRYILQNSGYSPSGSPGTSPSSPPTLNLSGGSSKSDGERPLLRNLINSLSVERLRQLV